MKPISIILVGAFLITLSAQAGTATGNGGHAVVCRNSAYQITRVELLDFYEARLLRGINHNLDSIHGNWLTKGQAVLKVLAAIEPDRGALYQNQLATFENDTVFMTDADLPPVPDSNHTVGIPRDCRLEQIAVQRAPNFPEDKRFTVNKDLWDVMDDNQKCGLALHEIIYRELLEQGDSVKARYFNSYITSSKLTEMSEVDYLDLVIRTGFATARIQGVLKSMGQITRGENKKIQFGTPVPGTTFSVLGRQYQIRNYAPRVTFYENGALRYVPAESASFATAQGLLIPCEGGESTIVFNSNGGLESCRVAQPDTKPFRLASNFYNLKPVSVTFDEQGILKHAVLNSGTESWGTLSGFQVTTAYSIANWTFYPNGALKVGDFRETLQFKVQGRDLSVSELIEVYSDGNLARGVLVESPTLTVGSKKVTFASSSILGLYPNGLIKNGAFSKSTEFPIQGKSVSIQGAWSSRNTLYAPLAGFYQSGHIQYGFLETKTELKVVMPDTGEIKPMGLDRNTAICLRMDGLVSAFGLKAYNDEWLCK